jgi:hypothetical protein
MSTLRTADQASRSGGAITMNAADATGDKFVNDSRTVWRWKNTSGSAITATVQAQALIDGQQAAGKSITIPATTGDIITDVWGTEYNNPVDNTVLATYSSATGLTVGCIRFTKVSGQS